MRRTIHAVASRFRAACSTIAPLAAPRRVAMRLRLDEVGSATAEYAVATVAACGFGGILFKILTADSVMKLLQQVITNALKHFL
jgi:hypothetical protein